MNSRNAQSWWTYAETGPACGRFAVPNAGRVSRLYFPLANEAGMRSWVTPRLQGAPAASHNEYLGLPLTAEDLQNSLVHRGFWLLEKGKKPFSLSTISPEGLGAHLQKTRGLGSRVDAGPGWFSVSREGEKARYVAAATLWCPADLDSKVEVMSIEVRNISKRPLTLTAYAAIPIFARSADNIRDHRHVTALLHRVSVGERHVTVQPTMTFDERGHRVNKKNYSALAFGPGGSAPIGIWTSEDSFVGEGGNMAMPAAVWRGEDAPSDREASTLHGREALAGFKFKTLTIQPGRTVEFHLISGISEGRAEIGRWLRWGSKRQQVKQSLAFTQKFWQEHISRISFATGDGNLDNWLAWVNFQPTLRRLYGNSYLPQFDYGRGGKGWRDLWQDCLALLLSDPTAVRPMLLHNFGGVRIDGSNATIIGSGGRFIADRNNIPRTWMDHGAWPAYTTFLYLDQTGDLDFLLTEREYFRDPQLYRCRQRDADWTEDYGFSLRSRGKGKPVYRGTILEHMLVQNLSAFFNVGEHNICRLEGADWNDGLDMADERGESVAFQAFYAWNLERLAGLVEALAARGRKSFAFAEEVAILLDRASGGRGVDYTSPVARQQRLKLYLDAVANDVSGKSVRIAAADLAGDLRAKSAEMSERVARQEWLHQRMESGFFNGYYDNNGKRVEGRVGQQIRMTLTGQVFPLMSGIASEEQVDEVERSVERHLLDSDTGGVRLNTDFGGIQPALGRAFSFQYGEKENGAVFSHMTVMYAYSLYLRRRPEAGRRVWHALYRMAHGSRALMFPCIPEYFNAAGRGMYHFLTGSASWMIYLLLTQVYGVRGELGDLVIDPQLLPEDFGANGECSVRTWFAGRRLAVTFVRSGSQRSSRGRFKVSEVHQDGRLLKFESKDGGGALIARKVVSKFASDREAKLLVKLEGYQAGL